MCIRDRVYGVIKPKICVPFNMEPEKMQYAILHEKEHIRRGDHIWTVSYTHLDVYKRQS